MARVTPTRRGSKKQSEDGEKALRIARVSDYFINNIITAKIMFFVAEHTRVLFMRKIPGVEFCF